MKHKLVRKGIASSKTKLAAIYFAFGKYYSRAFGCNWISDCHVRFLSNLKMTECTNCKSTA